MASSVLHLTGAALIAALLPAAPLRAQGVDTKVPRDVKIQQVQPNLPVIRVYLDVLNEQHKPVPGIPKEAFEASIADQRRPFEKVIPFQNSGEGVAYSLLIDVSLSIGESRFEEMQNAASLWINQLGRNDKMELVRVAAEPEPAQAFTDRRSDLLNALRGIKRDSDRTALYASLIRAFEDFTDELPNRRAVVVLTDGIDDDDSTGKTKEKLFDYLRDHRAPIYAIGVAPLRRPANAQRSLATLSDIADRSNGLYRELGSAPADAIFAEIRQAILGVYAGTIFCPACPHDGRPYAFAVSVSGKSSLPFDVLLMPPRQHSERKPLPWYGRPLVLAGFIALVVALAALGTWLGVRRRRKRATPVTDPPVAPEPEPEPQPQPAPPNTGTRIILATIHKDARYSAELVDNLVIGKGPECDLRIAGDNSLAERHCEIFLHQGLVYIRDLDGAGRTQVRGITITRPMHLEHTDVIRVGGTELRILIGGPK